MKYRIAEFPEAINTSGEMFFVQTGKVVRKKLFWIIYIPETVWERVEDRDKKPVGHKSINEAYKLIEELKKQEPIYHYIK